jgi:synaptosomal-associated protein 25
MSDYKKAPLKKSPFDSDSDSDNPQTLKPSNSASQSTGVIKNPNSNLVDDDIKKTASSSYSHNSASNNRYKNKFQDSGGLDNQSVQELENYAVYKAEETTNSVKNCLKIAEEIREDGTKTLVALHHQGEQITRTHMVAADIDQDLSRGEKLLGSLGGMFSKTWKPKKNHSLKGPIIIRDDPSHTKENHLEQREKLGINRAPKGRSSDRTPPTEPENALQKVEVEKTKQDDGLSDLSDLLDELKGMARDMGSEIERQNKALDPIQDDVEEINSRVKGASQHVRRLLGK